MTLIQIGNRILNTDAISWVQYVDDNDSEDGPAVLVYLNHPETAIVGTEEEEEPNKRETAWLLFNGLEGEALRQYLDLNVVTLLPPGYADENEEAEQN